MCCLPPHQRRPIPKLWLLYQNISWLKRTVFFIKGAEQVPCPCCGGELAVISSRRRTGIHSDGQEKIFIIRVLGCDACKRSHRELPDFIIPYKRHLSSTIETVITGDEEQTVIADESTRRRWKEWFMSLVTYFAGCLNSIAIRYNQEPVKEPSDLSESAPQRIFNYVGDAPGWLARMTKPIVNTNLWLHTRLAFMSG